MIRLTRIKVDVLWDFFKEIICYEISEMQGFRGTTLYKRCKYCKHVLMKATGVRAIYKFECSMLYPIKTSLVTDFI